MRPGIGQTLEPRLGPDGGRRRAWRSAEPIAVSTMTTAPTTKTEASAVASSKETTTRRPWELVSESAPAELVPELESAPAEPASEGEPLASASASASESAEAESGAHRPRATGRPRTDRCRAGGAAAPRRSPKR